MKRVNTDHPEQLAFSAWSGMPGLVTGLIFGGVGAGLKWGGVTATDASPETMEMIGVGLLSFGVFCITLRGGTIIDRQHNVVTRWIGLLVPMYRRSRSFEATGVHLTHEFDRNKGVTYHSYPVALVTPDGELQLGANDKVMPSWNFAQAVADFLGVELYDDSQEAIDTGLVPSVVRAVRQRSAARE